MPDEENEPMNRSEEPEKRRTPRVRPYVVPCRMTLPNGRLLSGYVTDLSPLGAQVSCDGPPPAVGIRVMLEVQPRRGPSWPNLSAEIKWTRPPARANDAPVCGLTFVEVEAAGQTLIEAALEEFRRRAALLERGQS